MYCGNMPQYPEEVIQAARGLFLRRHKIAEIHKMLNVPMRTLYHWRDAGCWDDLLQHESVEEATKRRLVLLVEKPEKNRTDLAEIELLTTSLERLQRLQERRLRGPSASTSDAAEAPEAGESPDQAGSSGRKRKGKKRKIKNDVSHLTAQDFRDKLHKNFYVYQHELREAKQYRNRFLLKSRQIGATWYFAQEAFEDAVLTGDNQIFLSATRAQADVFRQYIVAIAKQHFNIELKGKDTLELNTAHGMATLYFLSTSSRSAQSYHGHVYIDECFWINKFTELHKVATAMAAHKKWRRTLFSTPSVISHQAYPLWSGETFNKRFKKKRVEFPGEDELRAGIVCPDTIWRKVITLDDAERGGCDLFDRDQLVLENGPEEFDNLYRCKFIDLALGAFRLADLEECYTDSASWEDFNAKAERPFGNMPVWCGYDPSRTGDDASFVVVAPPLKAGGEFRVLARYKWIGQSFRWQAEQIRAICSRYNVQYMGVDITGQGIGVFELVQVFYPQVTAIHYGLQTKTHLVQKAQDVIRSGRITWDAGQTDIAHAFLTIRQTTTANGNITYAANRTNETGHADVAWAIMHALHNEPLADRPSGGCVFAMSA
ncbi:MAG: terminase large subunit domain-containing protein [Desulfovibrio sp.]|uniref:terminase large subunit domain-containing protein n=1 Tax=Desulfovibrio sp. 7SRBS1 TaxID=3378064 RepID=UPI003B412434